MEFPSRGVASTVAEDFCFFVDAEGGLSSGFLFFSIAAWACSSRKLRGAASVEVVAGSRTLGLSSAEGGTTGGRALLDVLPSVGTSESALPLALSGCGPNRSVTRGSVGGGSGVERGLSNASAASVST